MESNQLVNGDLLGKCSNPDCLKEAPLREFYENYRNREAFNVNEQFEHELEVDNQPSPKKAKIKEEFLEENEAKDFKIAHLEKEVEELKKKLEESKLEVDPQIKTQIENSIIIEERKKLDKQRAKFEEKETHLINQNALIQKLYQEKKEENERLLESDGEKGALTDLLPKNEIGKELVLFYNIHLYTTSYFCLNSHYRI